MTEIKATSTPAHTPWNKGKLVGQKPPLKLREIWTVRTRLQMAGKTRELALFNLAIDSKLRGCDLVRLRVRGVAHDAHVLLLGHGKLESTVRSLGMEVDDALEMAERTEC